MAIEFSWYLEKQIIFAKLSGKVGSADLAKGNRVVTQWMQESPARLIHIIFDATDMQGVGFSVTETLNTLKYLRDPKMGGYMVVGVPGNYDRIVKFLGGAINQFTRASFHVCKTLDEALTLIAAMDETLRDRIPRPDPSS